MAVEWGTGFECGNLGDMAINTNFFTMGSLGQIQPGGKGGSFCCYVLNGASRGYRALPVALSEYYMGAWISNIAINNGNPQMGFRLTDNLDVYIAFTNGTTFDAFVNTNKIASGITVDPISDWRNIQLYLKVADSGGRFIVKWEGEILKVDFTGDTKPGTATTISYCWWYGNNSNVRLDNLVMGTSWPGDIRFSASLNPISDASVAWTPSSGTSHYALIDEDSASDADYISSVTNGLLDLFDVSDWSGSDKIPVLVNTLCRAKKDTADNQSVTVRTASGGTNRDTLTQLITTYKTYMDTMTKNPNGNIDWTEAAINALQIGVISNIP